MTNNKHYNTSFIMRNTWAAYRAYIAEHGTPNTTDIFANMLRAEWQRVKAANAPTLHEVWQTLTEGGEVLLFDKPVKLYGTTRMNDITRKAVFNAVNSILKRYKINRDEVRKRAAAGLPNNAIIGYYGQEGLTWAQGMYLYNAHTNDDVLNEVVLSIVALASRNALKAIDGKTGVESLYLIMRSYACNAIRKHKPIVNKVEFDKPIKEGESGTIADLYGERDAAIDALIAQDWMSRLYAECTADQKQVFDLYIYGGYGYTDIGHKLHKSPQAVYSTMQKIIRKARRYIKEHGLE